MRTESIARPVLHDCATGVVPGSAVATALPERVADPPVRVTHVIFDFDGGGMETLVAEMAGRFRGTAVQLSLVTLSGRTGRLGTATKDRFESLHVVRPVRLASLVLPVSAARAIRLTRPDVVHLHTGAWYKGARAGRFAGAHRIVYTEHGREHDDPAVSRWIDRRAAALTDAVVAVSGRLARYLEQRVGIPRAKIRTIPNGVDTTKFTPAPATVLRQSLGIPDDAVVIGSIGRLETVKAYDTLLQATALLRARGASRCHVVLFGDGSQREALRAQAERLGVDDVLRLPGWTTQAVDAHRLLDVFVLPSRSEGQSVSLMEAMACGVVPVVSDVGANAEMLGPALRAHVVSPEQPEALADAIWLATSKRDAMRRIGATVRRRVIEQYSLDRMIERYERLYRGLSVPEP